MNTARRAPPAHRGLHPDQPHAFVLLAVVAAAIAVVSAFGQNLPDVDRLSEVDSATTTTRILARDGTVLARLYDKYRIYVPITGIPPEMKEAIVASEDERFYEHRGVDVRSIVRAAVADFKHEQITQGASTITQQLARTLFLNRNRRSRARCKRRCWRSSSSATTPRTRSSSATSI